ncbi:MAG: hypothetical protein J5563_01585 [Clostridia bacterium]|nr:hypothetical protein [Clostridia bacterium]
MKITGMLVPVTVCALLLFLCACSGNGKSGRESRVTDAAAEKGILTLDNDANGRLTEQKGGISLVDFAVREGTPLLKRNSFFINGSSNFRKFTPHLLELRSRTARFAMPLDCGSSAESVRNLMLRTQYDASGYGTVIRKYCTPLWIMFYATPAVRTEYGSNAKWYSPDYEIYDQMWTEAASYMAEKGLRSFYEVWNEPDQPNYMWYSGFEGYVELYEHSAFAVRKGDPDAFIGGPAMSSQSIVGADNMNIFVSAINDDGAPLDFFSMHYYGNDPKYSLEDNIAAIRASLENNPSTQIIFTEFNTHCPDAGEWDCGTDQRTDFTLQKSLAAAKGLDAMKTALSYTDVTQIQWANLFSNNGSLSLVDTKGRRSPLYHALWLYQHMPVERVRAEVGPGVSCLASADETEGGILLWNSDDKYLSTVSLGIDNIPYDEYTVKIFRIDKKHSSYLETGESDGLEAVTVLEKCHARNLTWDGVVPAGGIVYISIGAGGNSKLENHGKIGEIVRSDSFFESRKQNSYGDFDDLTCTAIIGTGENGNGRGVSYVTFKNPADRITVSSSYVNIPDKTSEDAFLTVRVDYHGPAGYEKSVAYEIINGKAPEKIPFGTMRGADRTVFVGLAEEFNIEIAEEAPEDWDGKIIISFDIGRTGAWSEASFRLAES